MFSERLAWAGDFTLTAGATFLATVPIASNLGRWFVVGTAILVILAPAAIVSYTQGNSGGARRQADTLRIGGDGNQVQSNGDHWVLKQAGQDIRQNGGRGHR